MNFCSANQKKARKWKPQVIVLGKGNKIVSTRGI
jgi:aspartate 1-decarboxylase